MREAASGSAVALASLEGIADATRSLVAITARRRSGGIVDDVSESEGRGRIRTGKRRDRGKDLTCKYHRECIRLSRWRGDGEGRKTALGRGEEGRV